MTSFELTDFRDGDAWLIFRLDAQAQNRAVDVYVIMNLPSGKLISFQVIDTDYLQDHHAKALFDGASARTRQWPKKVILASSDPGEAFLRAAAAMHNISVQCVPAPQLEDLIAPVKKSHGQHVFSPSSMAYSSMEDETDQMDAQSAKQMIPDAYDPCWCASGKKFKFCCKPIFREIVGAMASAEEGLKDDALRYIAEAKRIAGEIAEVLCREAIVWARFEKTKSRALLERSLAVDPNHPRANYIRGIDLKEAKNYSGAIEAYHRAAESYPKTDRYHLNETYNNLGTAYFEPGDPMRQKKPGKRRLCYLPSDKMVRQNLNESIYGNPQLSPAERAVSPFVKKYFERQR